MIRMRLLQLHRWAALAFALPLIAVILSGLVLAVEPALRATAPPATVTLDRLERVLDAAGAPRNAAIALRPQEGSVTVGGRGTGQRFDLATAAPLPPSSAASVFGTARRLHETLLLDLGWLVTASTAALLVLLPLGLLLGWPRRPEGVGGWHQAGGWALLPLLVASPLTGLFLALGISLAPPAPPVAGPAPDLRTTLRLVAERHDLNGLEWIRPLGGAPLIRVLDSSGTSTFYRAGAEGLVAQPRPWVRVLHEGSWLGVAGSAANLVLGAAFAGLLGSGLWLWVRRKLRMMRRRRRAVA
jgi:uncharacterized iron-regulated membrane protein